VAVHVAFSIGVVEVPKATQASSMTLNGPIVTDWTHGWPLHDAPGGIGFSAEHSPVQFAGGFVIMASAPSSCPQSAACAVMVVGRAQDPVDGPHVQASHDAAGIDGSACHVI
jgi:hypothetical protein